MNTDKLTKLLLAAIAFGLWANVITSWLKPIPAFADASLTLDSIEISVKTIDQNLMKWVGAGDICTNKKICD